MNKNLVFEDKLGSPLSPENISLKDRNFETFGKAGAIKSYYSLWHKINFQVLKQNSERLEKVKVSR